jgi:folate-binding protein YgfZ
MMERAGGVGAEYHGRTLMRHFGDPAGEYEAARGSSAVFDRSHRTRLIVRGRAPGQMLNGVLTGTLPGMPEDVPAEDGAGPLCAGRWTYQAVLTPKGKMITDLWVTSLGDEETTGYLLDVPVAGGEGLVALLGRVLPPRFATWRDATSDYAMISVVGPDASALLSHLALEDRVSASDLASLEEGEWLAGGSPVASLIVSRIREVEPLAYSVTGPSETVVSLWESLASAGVRPAGLGVWSTLRVEAGRPAFGTDMGEDTIPVEAGIDHRAIDHAKGCYTGQEVIVRIRDRGHVNRHLRQLELGDVPTPAQGTELMAADGSGKVAGWITSAVQSPSRGAVVALAYVVRGAERVLLDGREIAVPS